MKRRKLLITGAAFILLVQTGLTSLASEQNVFPAKNMQAGIGKYYCGNHVQKHVGRHLCAAVDGSVVCGLGIHHGVTVYTDGNNTGNCHFENGYCTSWADTDGDGYCDACRNPVFREPVQQTNAGGGDGNAAGYGAGGNQDKADYETAAGQGQSSAGDGSSNNDTGWGYGSMSYGFGCGSGHHGRGHHR